MMPFDRVRAKAKREFQAENLADMDESGIVRVELSMQLSGQVADLEGHGVVQLRSCNRLQLFAAQAHILEVLAAI